MDYPLRTKLMAAFVGIALFGGLLMALAGTWLLNRMVVGEAQRRVQLGLKTARASLDRERLAAQRVTGVLADWAAQGSGPAADGLTPAFLEKLRRQNSFDLLHVVDASGKVVVTARGQALGRFVGDDPIVRAALAAGQPRSGLRLIPLAELAVESPALAAQAQVPVRPTPAAKPTSESRLTEAMLVETASPIVRGAGQVIGVVRSGAILNRDFALVDQIRANIFTVDTYRGRNLGTVTIFQNDVRIATNVTDENGERAIGTRISAEVGERVLEQGQRWFAPAFVVNTWYISAYEPIEDFEKRIIGILYVGVLKQRYDDMRAEATATLLSMAALALVLAIVMALFLSRRLTRPLTRLTAAAGAIAAGNLQYELAPPPRAQRDEAKQLTVSFTRMMEALRERDEQLRRSYDNLQQTTQELHRWNQNYLETLEFITHELKNQVAAMKLNLLAVRDGYVGEVTPEQHDALDDIAQTLRRTEEMILNYLNLSRIEKGELEVRARPVALQSDVLDPVMRELSSRFADDDMTVELALPPGLLAQADPTLLQIVFSNLLGNAAKYGKRGGHIRVFGEQQEDRVEVHVWNDGAGVKAEELDHLFQRFSRLSGGEVKQRGIGLGLFIAREIVRKHGGDLRVETQPGEWIDFILTLPRADTGSEPPIG